MERITKLVLPSLIFLIGTLILFFINLQQFINVLGILSALLQIAMFIYWIFDDNKQDQILDATIRGHEELKETRDIIKDIKDYQHNQEGILLKRQEILTNLIRGGAIPNKEINKIIKSMRKKGMFLVSTLGGKEFKLKKVLKSMERENAILLVPAVLKKFKFKRVYFNDNLFIILKEDLPSKLRKSEKLKEVIYNELQNNWKQIQNYIIKNKIKVHNKWIDGSGFNCNLCIIDIEEGEMGIIYKRLQDSPNYRDNFSEEFKSLLLGHSGKKNIGEIVQDKIKAKIILDKMSLGFLFTTFPEDLRDNLIKNEVEITKKMGVTKFKDISKIKSEKLKKVILQYVPSDRLNEICDKIMEEIEDYIRVVTELNLFNLK